MTDLGVLPGDFMSQANGMNNKGQVVGTSCNDTNFDICHGFLWHDGVMTGLDNLIQPNTSLTTFIANDINDRGEIAGAAIKQQLRATVFRNCEIDIHTANGVAEALRLCRVERYDMVLLAGDHDFGEVSLFCDELRKVAPRQRIAQLIGPPKYVWEMRVQQEQPSSGQPGPDRRLHLVEHSQPTYLARQVPL